MKWAWSGPSSTRSLPSNIQRINRHTHRAADPWLLATCDKQYPTLATVRQHPHLWLSQITVVGTVHYLVAVWLGSVAICSRQLPFRSERINPRHVFLSVHGRNTPTGQALYNAVDGGLFYVRQHAVDYLSPRTGNLL